MPNHPRSSIYRQWLCLPLLLLGGSLQAGFFTDTGYEQLSDELGEDLPDGTGVRVSQVEFEISETRYIPDVANSELTHITVTDQSNGDGSTSSHATDVGRMYYGNFLSMAPGVSDVDAYSADDFLNNRLATGYESNPVANHSWIITNINLVDSNALLKFDYSVQLSDHLAVAGLNNGSGNSQPDAWIQAYNVLAVGLTSGNHSRGTTTREGIGRIVPHIVANPPPTLQATSYSTGLVSSAATMLVQHARETTGLANAEQSQAMKAILMAGATKEEFPGWSRSTTQPIDLIYGAGELNIFNSYYILDAGEQTPSDSVLTGSQGWDYHSGIAEGGSERYFFEVPEGQKLNELSIILTWHRKVTKSGVIFTTYNDTVANMSLSFAEADGFSTGTQLDSSDSLVDNIEHIYIPGPLYAGQYVIEVSSDDLPGNNGPTAYGLAWRSTLSPLDTFADWQASFLAGQAAQDQEPDADPDGDGISNLGEYFRATDPLDSTFVPAAMQSSYNTATGKLALQYQRRASMTDLTETVLRLELDGSTFAASYTETQTTPQPADDLHPEDYEIVTREVDIDTETLPTAFYQLQVEQQ